MASSSSRAHGLGYGSLGQPPLGDDDSGNNSSGSHPGRRQSWPWLRVCIASVAVVAALGLLRSSSPTSSAAPPGGNHLIDPSAESNLAQDTAYRVDTPRVSGDTSAAAAAAGAGEEELAFVASNEYTRRGDVVGLGYPWLEVWEVSCCGTFLRGGVGWNRSKESRAVFSRSVDASSSLGGRSPSF